MKKYRLPDGSIMEIYWTYRHRETFIITNLYSGDSMASATRPYPKMTHYIVHDPWYYRLFHITPRLREI